MWEATFFQHYNFAKDTFNVSDDKDYESIKAEVIKLLKMKYSLEIISEDPLDLKKIEETLNTYSHMFSTALDSVVSVIDSLEDD